MLMGESLLQKHFRQGGNVSNENRLEEETKESKAHQTVYASTDRKGRRWGADINTIGPGNERWKFSHKAFSNILPSWWRGSW